MRARKRYPENLKAEAMKLVINQGMSHQEASDLLGIPRGTIGNWAKKAQKEMLQAIPGRPSVNDIIAENRRLKREHRKLKMESDFLIKSSYVLSEGVVARYTAMMNQRHNYPVSLMAKLLGVSKSGFYRWLTREPSKRAREAECLKPLIRELSKKYRGAVGALKIQQELKKRKIYVGRDRILRLRKELKV